MKRMWDENEIEKIAKEQQVELTPDTLADVLEGSDTVVVDTNEEGDKLQVRLDNDVVTELGKIGKTVVKKYSNYDDNYVIIDDESSIVYGLATSDCAEWVVRSESDVVDVYTITAGENWTCSYNSEYFRLEVTYSGDSNDWHVIQNEIVVG